MTDILKSFLDFIDDKHAAKLPMLQVTYLSKHRSKDRSVSDTAVPDLVNKY